MMISFFSFSRQQVEMLRVQQPQGRVLRRPLQLDHTAPHPGANPHNETFFFVIARVLEQGSLTEGEGSVRLTSLF
jgi:hypothetical protein